LELVQPLPAANFSSSGGTLVGVSARVLQQLRQAIAAGGIVSSLPITADSFSRVTGQALLEIGERAKCRGTDMYLMSQQRQILTGPACSSAYWISNVLLLESQPA
jgi:hypothetical protein